MGIEYIFKPLMDIIEYNGYEDLNYCGKFYT